MSTTNQKKFLDKTPIQQFLVGGFHQKFVETLVATTPTSILELGCGEGYLLEQIHRRLPDVKALGLDNTDIALAEGRRIFPHLDLRFGDIYHVDQPDKSWDVVLASEVLEHLDQPDVALSELKRVAKRYTLFSVPNEPWFRLGNLGRGRHLKRFGNHPEHVNLWSQSGFARFVAEQMQVEKVINAFPWTIVLARV